MTFCELPASTLTEPQPNYALQLTNAQRQCGDRWAFAPWHSSEADAPLASARAFAAERNRSAAQLERILHTGEGAMDPLVLAIVLKLAPWFIAGLGALFFARSAFGKALAHRIREGTVTSADLAALSDELQEARREIGEMQERLDFAEHLLAQHREALPPCGSSGEDTPTPPELVSAGRP